MTIKLPNRGFPDWVLSRLGKKRGVIVPAQGSVDGYVCLRWESFFSALCRPADMPLPEGVVDISEFKNEFKGDV